ncbi:uncharacterized protein LOC144868784 isoform X2 [Branchiostoma floridae x Branchiostoma japonicum]
MMQRIWTPAQPPPDPVEIQVRSPEASVILSVLRRAQRRRPDGRDYYRCLYTKKFGAPPDGSISGNSQSTTGFSQATCSQRSEMNTLSKEKCVSRHPLISTEPSWRGTSDKSSITNPASQISHHLQSSPFPQSTAHNDAPRHQNVTGVIPFSQVVLPGELNNASGHAPQTDMHPFSELTDYKLTNTTTVLDPICAKGKSDASFYQEDVGAEEPLSSQVDLFLSQSSTPVIGCKMSHPTCFLQDAEEENFSGIAGADPVEADREGNRETEESSPLFECSPSHCDNDYKEENKTTSYTGLPLLDDSEPQATCDSDLTATSNHSNGSQKSLDSAFVSSEVKDREICVNHKVDKTMSQQMQDTSIDKQSVQLQLKIMSAEPMIEDHMELSEQMHSLSPQAKQLDGSKSVETSSSIERIEDLSFDIGCLADDSDIMEGSSPEMLQAATVLPSQETPLSHNKADVSEYLHTAQTQQTSAFVAIKEPVTKANADGIQTEREPTITSTSPCEASVKVRKPNQAICGAYEDKKSQNKESTPHCSDPKSHPQAPGSAIHNKLLLSTPSTVSVTRNGANISDASGSNASFVTPQTAFGNQQGTDKKIVTSKSLSPIETPKQDILRSKNAPSTESHTEMLPMEDKRATPGSAIQTKLQLWTKANRSEATPNIKRTSKSTSSSDELPAKKQQLFPVPQANKRTFKAPFKGEGKQTNQGEPKKRKTPEVKDIKSTIRDASVMSQCERQQAVTDILGAGEVSMALVYGDGTSQLREPTTKGIPKDSDNKAVGIAIAVPGPSSGAVQACSGQAKRIRQLQFIMFPLTLDKQDYAEYCRETLTQLMTSKACRVCLDAQELILTMISHFSLDVASVYNWSMVDPKVAGWLLNPDHPPNTFTEVVKMCWKENSQDDDANTLLCQDLSRLLEVMELLRRRLVDCDLLDLYLNVEMKLTPILASMEYHGICVDPQCLIKMGDILKKRIGMVVSDAYKAAGHRFLLSSHVQLRTVLFDELHLDERCDNRQKLARTSVNNLKSTSESVLVQLQDLHPLPKLVLEYRKLEKMKSTYVDGILACIKEGKLTATWDHTSAATGRLTSANPNIQSVPKQPLEIVESSHKQPAEGGKHETTTLCAREPYVAREGCSFLSADFQSIEFRLLAHFSKDPSLLKVFQGDDVKDVFMELTSQWMNVPLGSVQTADRERTKRVVYSIMYGVGPEKLATYLNVSAAEAKGFISSFLRGFPGVSRFTHKCKEECKAKGHVRTILKRWRLIPNIKSPNFFLRSQAERQAVNFVVQGSAADICKLAMILVGKRLAEEGLKAKLLIQLHDELVFEVADEEVDSVKGVVRDIMQSDALLGGQIKLQVPLRVSVSVGKSWGRMTDLE